MRSCMVLICLTLVILTVTESTSAGTHQRGPYTIQNNAYSDQTLQISGPTWSESSPGWLDPFDAHCLAVPFDFVLVEGSQAYPFLIYGFADLRADIVIEVRFLNNTAINLAGPDIVIFQLDKSCPGAEARTPGGYTVAVPDGEGGFTEFLSYPKELAEPSGTEAYSQCVAGHCLGIFDLSSIAIDLSDFGVAEGERISSLRFSTPDGADPVAIAALYSAPLPVRQATWGQVKALYR